MKKQIKKMMRKIGIEINRYRPSLYGQVVSLKPEKSSRGNVLLSYRLEPFLTKMDELLLNNHHNYWRSRQIAKTFLQIGYCVDVIDFRNMTYVPQKDYAFFIDVRHNLERLTPWFTKECIKIFYIDTAHILFHNAAECQRLLNLQQRKGVTLCPRRYELPNRAIEHADCAITHGNAFVRDTFGYANKPIYTMPQIEHVMYPYPEDKDYEICRKSFVWLGSGGFVHKGLDLVLDAFSQMPDYQLYICGPLEEEKDFEKVYYRELHETPNIHTVGMVDVTGPQFNEITEKCIGLIYPSCSEGGAGSVIHCMHAGIIPIISKESGIDVHDFGLMLSDCSVESIKFSLQTISNLSNEKLKYMTSTAWEEARANHSKDRFAEEYRKLIEKLIISHGKEGFCV